MLQDWGNHEAQPAPATGPLRVLLVERDPRAALWIGEMVRAAWSEPLVLAHAERLEDAARDLTTTATRCVLLDVCGSVDWPDEVAELREAAPHAAIVVLGEGTGEGEALAALRAGAQDYLPRSSVHLSGLARAIRQAMERRRTELQLAHRALHDSLTGLPNRALFLDRLGVALDRARRSGALVAVLFLDVDNFKDVNDTRGHASGDRLLIELAERLRRMLRPMDTVARFGGDEFTFLFEDLADEHEVVLIADRIGRACKTPIELQPGETTITVSMGIAMVSDPRTPVETVISEADAAMYRAKERGRGRYELFDESTRARAIERLELEVSLRRAIDEHQFRVHYQPNVSLESGAALVGLEALLRWQHPERGLIGAHEFIGLAEETGLVLEIGQYVLHEVLRAATSWRSLRPGMTISVNLSLRELEDIGLLSSVAAALRSAEVEPDAICMEVAESALTRNPAVAARVLRGLKELGVRTAIDDFGTGSSSVLSLRELPLDAIKLDQSLVREMGEPSADAPVLGALVGLGHALGLQVVAEGVETEAQAEGLRELGCDGAQGYLFAAPVPEEDVESLLDGAPSFP